MITPSPPCDLAVTLISPDLAQVWPRHGRGGVRHGWGWAARGAISLYLATISLKSHHDLPVISPVQLLISHGESKAQPLSLHRVADAAAARQVRSPTISHDLAVIPHCIPLCSHPELT